MAKKILCAVDGTDHSSHAVDEAANMANKLGAELTICTVNVLMGGGRAPLIYAHDDKELEKVLDDAVSAAKLRGADKTKPVLLRSREAAAGIVDYAEQEKFDHIVTGTGDRSRLSRLVLGSVAAEVARRAHCTVTVAR